MTQINYNVRDPEIEALLKSLGDRLKFSMPPGWGFNLMLFTYGEGGNLFYISSAEREDVIKVMKEFIARNTM